MLYIYNRAIGHKLYINFELFGVIYTQWKKVGNSNQHKVWDIQCTSFIQTNTNKDHHCYYRGNHKPTHTNDRHNRVLDNQGTCAQYPVHLQIVIFEIFSKDMTVTNPRAISHSRTEKTHLHLKQEELTCMTPFRSCIYR